MSRLQELFGMRESDLPWEFRYVMARPDVRVFLWRGEVLRYVAKIVTRLAHWFAIPALRRWAWRVEMWHCASSFASTLDNATRIEQLMLDKEQRNEKIRAEVRRQLDEKSFREATGAEPFSEPSAIAKATEAMFNLSMAFGGLGGGPDVNSRIRIAQMKDSAELCLTLGIAYADYALDDPPPDPYKADYIEARERARLRRALIAQGDSANTSSGVHGTQEQLKK